VTGRPFRRLFDPARLGQNPVCCTRPKTIFSAPRQEKARVIMGDKAAIFRLFLELLREQPDFEG